MLKPIFENIPDELKKKPHWVNWRVIERDGKATKPPYQPNGQFAKSDDPATWSTYDAAMAAADGFDGIGFVLTNEDAYVALDYDKCYCPAFKFMDPQIEKTVRRMDTLTELSPSGRGIRQIFKATLPFAGKRRGRIEIYQSGRYVTMTGNFIDGFSQTIEHRQREVDALIKNVIGVEEKSPDPSPKDQQKYPGNWKKRLERAFQSTNGAAFKQLYDGDWSAYSSQSEAELALCSFLAFWLMGNRAAIDAAFRESGLFRKKWDEKHHGDGRTYGAGTIDKAISGCQNFYNEGREETLPAATSPWPVLDKVALHGVAGEWVRGVSPHTEADAVALLSQFLVAFGNMVGRGPYFQVEATQHHCNDFLLLVGKTANGRKGTSWDHARLIASLIDEIWASRCIKSGLTSGEGLIYHVRDPQSNPRTKTNDPGVIDKRILAYESEFATVLKIVERKENTLSAILRDSWDRGDLRTLAKQSPTIATGAHVSIVSHITQEELRMRLSNTESFNGFANRFLIVCVKRSKLLPEGGGSVELSGILPAMQKAFEFSQTVGEMKRDEEARAIWFEVYEGLTRERPGILGGVLSRDCAHVVRLSMIYALLDCSAMIRKEHLLAALACWEFVEASARYIFDTQTGAPMADTIYEAVVVAGDEGINRTSISNGLFQRNKSAAQIDQAVEVLVASGKVRIEKSSTGGRKEERLFTI